MPRIIAVCLNPSFPHKDEPNVPTQSNRSDIPNLVGTFNWGKKPQHTKHTSLTGHHLPSFAIRLHMSASSRVLLSQSPQTRAPSACLKDRNSNSRCRERKLLLRIERGGAGAFPHWLGAPSVSAKFGSYPLKIESERSWEKSGGGVTFL